MAQPRNNTKASAFRKPKEAEGKALRVVAKRDGFRRAGREWHGATVVPTSELDDQQYLQLTTDPMLDAILVDLPSESTADNKVD